MTLTLKTVNQFFCMTHRLVIIHHHTKFSKKKKRVERSGNTEWTQSDTRTELQTDGQTDGRTDGWTDGQTGRVINITPYI